MFFGFPRIHIQTTVVTFPTFVSVVDFGCLTLESYWKKNNHKNPENTQEEINHYLGDKSLIWQHSTTYERITRGIRIVQRVVTQKKNALNESIQDLLITVPMYF